jgi:hypothetical protein
VSVTGLLETYRASNRRLVALAEAVSLAVRVEPELLRRARLDLVPEADASVEADLWFSPLVDTQSATAFMFVPEVADRLRRGLARDLARLEGAWTITSEIHANVAPAIALEEEVNYLLLAEGAASSRLQDRLKEAVVALVAGGEERAGVARWALRALSRLPASVVETEAGQMLTVAARSRLGRADVLPEGVSPDVEWLPWVLPREADRVRVGVQLFSDGLEIGSPDEASGHVIPLPDTNPLMLHVSWREGVEEQAREVRIVLDRPTRIRVRSIRGVDESGAHELAGSEDAGSVAPTFTLQTAWGEVYTIRPRAVRVSVAIRARAGSHGAFVAWRPSGRIDGCLGFALYRRERDGKTTLIARPDEVGTSGDAAQRPTTTAPVQDLTWLDSGLETGDVVQYRAVPMIGSPETLFADESGASEWSDPVSFTTEPGLAVTFNRGVLGLAALADRIGDGTTPLRQMIEAVGSEAREYLGGDLRSGLMTFLADVRDSGGTMYAALHELSDPEALIHLSELGPRAHVLLPELQGRRGAANTLLQRKAAVQAAVPTRGGLFHHRFAVACASSGEPEQVWIGGANWTAVALCVQANGATIVSDRKVAALFLERWRALASRDRRVVDQPSTVINVGSAAVSVWFTPVRRRIDLADIERRLNAAQQGILFASAFASRQSVLGREVARRRSSLYRRGVISDDPRGSAIRLLADTRAELIDPKALLASAPRSLKDFGRLNEFLARIVAIDPFSQRPTVLTGSHGLTPTGSEKNDETLLVVEGAPAFAAAHAVRVEELYRHYAARAAAAGGRIGTVNLVPDDAWQERWLDEQHQRELGFWLGQPR